MTVMASATPEKRLFVSLITRDISLSDAILDLIDNSVNAAMQDTTSALNSSKNFYGLLARKGKKPDVKIELKISQSSVSIEDNAGGIDLGTAKDGIFHFGASDKQRDSKDRLSVFGIGLKRAIFKIGNDIKMWSDHTSGGFSMNLNADQWEATPQEKWAFAISARPKVAASKTGTSIKINELREDVRRRISDPTFLTTLEDKVAKTYAYFLDRLVQISINSKAIKPIEFEIGKNISHQNFVFDKVEYSITAGIRAAAKFTAESAGWFVFCNGRALLYADKSDVTGWGGDILPAFQPKHRPFLGLVFFYSKEPERLPWTTTKDSVNQESLVWQQARRQMAATARPVLRLLDERYTNEGTEITGEDLQELAGQKVSGLVATRSENSVFRVSRRERKTSTRIQFDAKDVEIATIRKHLGTQLSASAVGRLAFDYYLKNEVGSK